MLNFPAVMLFVEPTLLVMVTVPVAADFVTQILPAVIDVAYLLFGSESNVIVAEA